MNPNFFPASLPKSPEQAAKAFDDAFRAQLSKASLGLSPIALALAYLDWSMHLATSPARQLELAQQALALAWQPDGSVEDGAAVAEDPRFQDAGWNRWPYSALKQRFLQSEAWWHEASRVDGVSGHHQQMVDFFARQTLDALSPSNWPATNPEVLRQGLSSFGQTWRNGYQNYLLDQKTYWQDRLGADTEPHQALHFEVGKDVAVTPGKVVFRNHLIELIQYQPSTPTVYPEPLLIVPSCIMKYYILDLSPANSMVRYLVDKGHTVFMVSWRNPDASDRDLGMQDYLHLGVIEAMAAVKALTGRASIHALGYCLGGTFLSIAAALLGRHTGSKALSHVPTLASVTLLAAMTDFSEPGEMGVFIDKDQVQALKEQMARKGYLTGKQMAGAFQFLNSRDLVWSHNMRRYLLGQDEVGNDMMSWNADVTRLPARMHSEYLDSLFLENALAKGRFQMNGETVALMDIRAPMLVVGTARDHVSPWKSVYKIHLLTDTQTTFILASGGHNAGIVSEPGHPHRSYQIDAVEPGHAWVEPDTWQANAPQHEGSWWEALHAWLRARSGKPVRSTAIKPAQVLGEAPGEYVMVRYTD